MDSLTQITLGAACGEIIGGKKVGNRAMLWGAVAGTIPDLDVFIGRLMDPLSDLAFHRGITHSFFFAITFSALLAWLIKKMYDQEWYKLKAVRMVMAAFALLFLVFCASIVYMFAGLASAGPNIPTIIVCGLLIALFGYRLWKYYVSEEQADLNMSFKQWYALIFLATVTHPILDCCTTYGNQLFQPFWDKRVAWNNISVADPLYTFPFLIFVIWAAFLNPQNKRRKIFLWTGIGISMLYMSWTFINKAKVNKVFRESMVAESLEFERYMSSPSILNNILWHCVAEVDTNFYIGSYSLLDSEAKIKDFIRVPKNEYLINYKDGDHTIETLRWFSDGYTAFLPGEDGSVQVNDLRFGSLASDWSDPDAYIFHFNVKENESGEFIMEEAQGGPPEGDQSEWFIKLWQRIKGI